MNRSFLVGLRLSIGILILVAVISQALYIHNVGALNIVNFLSYFTNLSNILAGVIFIFSGLYLAQSRNPNAKDDIIRGAATLYMAVTGLVYITLLSGEDLGLLMPWVNFVTHILAPIVIVSDWLYQPPRTKLVTKQISWWLIFPAGYLVYTLIRGSIVGWYPYPFLNPATVGGYGGVALYCLAILTAFFVLSWLLMKLGRTLKRNVA